MFTLLLYQKISYFFRLRAAHNSVGKVRRCYYFSDVGAKYSTRQVSNSGNSTVDIGCTSATTTTHSQGTHTSKEMDLQGLEDVPDFWDMDMDDDDEIIDSQMLNFAKHRGRLAV